MTTATAELKINIDEALAIWIEASLEDLHATKDFADSREAKLEAHRAADDLDRCAYILTGAGTDADRQAILRNARRFATREPGIAANYLDYAEQSDHASPKWGGEWLRNGRGSHWALLYA